MLVEGQSDEAFVKQTLKPWLAERSVFVQGPVVLWTRRLPAGGGDRGGVGSWAQIRKSLAPLLGDSNAWVTTLLDFYGLPDDLPGFVQQKGQGNAHEQVANVQAALADALGNPPRFVPFLALHELEAWLFVAPTVVSEHFGSTALAAKLAAEVPDLGGPESINHGPTSHPCARLSRHCPSYKKTSDGPTMLGKIGIAAIRDRCPHFDGWLTRLEALGAAA